jgi:hypothetical protein
MYGFSCKLFCQPKVGGSFIIQFHTLKKWTYGVNVYGSSSTCIHTM